MHKERSVIATPAFCDPKESLFSGGRVLLKHEAEPIRDITCRLEPTRIADRRKNCCRAERSDPCPGTVIRRRAVFIRIGDVHGLR